MTYSTPQDAVGLVHRSPSPLAAYFFTCDSKTLAYRPLQFAFGTAAIHATLLQFASSGMPFRVFGGSGFGRSHGKVGFDTFPARRLF